MPCHRVVGSHGALGGFSRAAATATRSRSSAGCSRTRAIASAPDAGTEPAAPRCPSSADADADGCIDAFCDQLWLQDGLAPASLASYRRDLVAVGGVARARAARRSPARSAPTSRPASPTSSAPRPRRRRSRAGCPRCAASTGCSCSAATLRADPTLRVRAPKLPRRLPKSLTEKQVEALLAAPDDRHDAGPARPRDAGDALRDGPARVRARRPQARRRCRSTWASCA